MNFLLWAVLPDLGSEHVLTVQGKDTVARTGAPHVGHHHTNQSPTGSHAEQRRKHNKILILQKKIYFLPKKMATPSSATCIQLIPESSFE